MGDKGGKKDKNKGQKQKKSKQEQKAKRSQISNRKEPRNCKLDSNTPHRLIPGHSQDCRRGTWDRF